MPGEDFFVRDGAGGFPPTQWSVVLKAARVGSPEADHALAALCESYWFPLYAFTRRRGSSREEAEDLTQQFFARLAHKEMLAGLAQTGGKFRTFLLAAFTRFVSNEHHRQHAQKRGGGQFAIAIDDSTEMRYQRELVVQATPETLFERQWALTVLNRVLDRLRDEYAGAGKRLLFEWLERRLPGAESHCSYAEASAALHMTEPALRMAAQRLRARYREVLRAEIASTVSCPEEIGEELRHLKSVLCRP